MRVVLYEALIHDHLPPPNTHTHTHTHTRVHTHAHTAYADGIGKQIPWKGPAPDAVLILIGPNDYTSIKRPTDANFIARYTELLNYVDRAYGTADRPPIAIHVCGGSGNGFDPCDNIWRASEQWNINRSSAIRSFYVSISKRAWKKINSGSALYNGCDGHYSHAGHTVLAGEVLPDIRKALGW